MLDNGLYLDMINMNRILHLSREDMTVTVQSGVTWDHLQRYLDKYNLSVAEMQSYRNFTVGGSISVNCHGRGLMYPTIAESIVNLKVMLSNGKIMDCGLNLNTELFRATVGGYGLISIILEATLEVVKNDLLMRQVVNTNRQELPDFIRQIIQDEDVHFYNCTT